MSKVIGIDLGASNSRVAVYELNQVSIIPNSFGGRVTPSVVAHTKTGERLIGEPAKRQAVTNYARTAAFAKGKMGTDHRVQIGENKYAPQVISAMILAQLKKDAEDYLGEPVNKAVITVPAYFNSVQRQAVIEAAEIAGFEFSQYSHTLINDCTATAFANVVNREHCQKTLILDLGAGSFDASVIDSADGIIEVLSASGSNQLGGDAFDRCIVDYLVEDLKIKTGIDLTHDNAAMCRVREAAENAKNELSYAKSTMVNLPYLCVDSTGPKHMEITLSRAKFDDLTKYLVGQIAMCMQRVVVDSGLTMADLDGVLMVGGGRRIPAVRDAVRQITGKNPFDGINADESVVIGAVIQGAILSGEIRDYVALDLLTASVGVETAGDTFTKIIDRNTTISCLRKQTFSTSENFQKSIDIKVLQGESTKASENVRLGTFRMEGIQMAERGVPRIEVTFEVDWCGVVKVTARDKSTGNEQLVNIANPTSMSRAEIERAKRDIAAHAND